MFLEGGPAAPVTPAPVVPAPAPVAPVAPAPEPTAPTQQPTPRPSLADAQLTSPVTLPSVAPVAPTAPTTPQAPQGSPDAVAAEQKRVADAQRKMHEATAEAAKLRNQLNNIINHPLLGPVIQKVTNPQAPADPKDDEVKQAFKDWQAAPSDEDAFRQLLAVTEKRAKKSVLDELEQRRVEQTNRARAQQRDLLVAKAINKEVNEKAPDVPVELFWAMSSRAEAETPMHLVTVADKLEWQISRAVQLARDVIGTRTQAVQAASSQSQSVRQTAAVVMPSGTQQGGGGSPQTQAPTNFVDQLKAAQIRKVPAST